MIIGEGIDKLVNLARLKSSASKQHYLVSVWQFRPLGTETALSTNTTLNSVIKEQCSLIPHLG